eukprot:jgi/Chlat1/2596/Chrsp178S02447
MAVAVAGEMETKAASVHTFPTRALWLAAVGAALRSALCLSAFPCQAVERHDRPEVEFAQDESGCPEVVLPPLMLARGGEGGECCLIEASINSARVSLRLRGGMDDLEAATAAAFLRFLAQRAEAGFPVLRKRPVQGYHVSFLITNAHTARMVVPRLVQFILQFFEDLDKEVSELKLAVNARGRAVATDFLKPLA